MPRRSLSKAAESGTPLASKGEVEGGDKKPLTPAKRRRKEARAARRAAAQEGDEEATAADAGDAAGPASPEGSAAPGKTPAPSKPDDDADAELGSSLLHLRSLLTPAGFGESVAAAAPKSDADAPPDDESAGQGPSVVDWSARCYAVNASDASVPLENLPWPLHPAVESSLRKAGYTRLFPIQAAVIPLLSRSADMACDSDSPYCCDVCVAAPTGQGKTLAYAVPLVQALLHRTVPQPRALVVLPTRDLAIQVYRVFEQLRQGLGPGVVQLRMRCLIGQRSLAEEQGALERTPPDVIICTPGRLADHVLGRTGRLSLGALRWFVADEADRLLTQAYHRWLDVLDRAAGPARDGRACGPRLQKLLLSATMTWNPQKLAMLRLHRPVYFFSSQTGRHATPAELHQHYAVCTLSSKPLAVLHILGCMLRGELEGQPPVDSAKALVFCPSVDTSRRLTWLLKICCVCSQAPCHAKRAKGEGGAPADDPGPTSLLEPKQIAEFSSNLTQTQRTILLRRFRRAQVKCLVCSDIAARGIDIPEVSVVVNYSPPSHLQTYIHRVGRTARAGRTGHTFTLARRKEMFHFKAMLKESADCSSRLQLHPMPISVRNAKRPWYEDAQLELQRQLEEDTGGSREGRPQAEGTDDAAAGHRGDGRKGPGDAAEGKDADNDVPGNGTPAGKDVEVRKGVDRSQPEAHKAGSAAAPALGGTLLDFAKALRQAPSRAFPDKPLKQ